MGELRASAGVWLISIATLASAIFFLGRVDQPNIELPEIPKEACASAVFIGSSLTASGILVDQATTATDEHRTELSSTCILSLPAISELETLSVIEHAVTWQPSIIFVEINALATDARGIKNIPYASNLIERWLAVQHQMARSLKNMVKHSKDRASSTRTVSTQGTRLVGAAPEGKVPIIYPRRPRLVPRFREVIEFAESHGTLIAWFWPPQFPKEAPNSKSQTTKLRSHVVALCERLETQCWMPLEVWSKHYFYDRLGHLNELGAVRLTAELKDWSSKL